MSLRQERLDLGMTQKQLAEKAGVNIRWLQKVERGEISLENVTVTNAFKLLKALYEDSPDEVVAESYSLARVGYTMIKALLAEKK